MYLHVRAHNGCIIAEPRGIRIVSINQSADRICRLEGREREREKIRERKKAYYGQKREKYELDFFSDALTFIIFRLILKLFPVGASTLTEVDIAGTLAGEGRTRNTLWLMVPSGTRVFPNEYF